MLFVLFFSSLVLLLLLLILFLSRFALFSLLFIYSCFCFCYYYHQGCFFLIRIMVIAVVIVVVVVLSCAVFVVVIVMLFSWLFLLLFPVTLLLLSLVLCLLLWLVLPFGMLVLFSCFWYFLSAMVAVGSHCASAWFVHSSYLVFHPSFISVNYLHPIAAEVLIVSLRTVNLHCKNYISVKNFNFCIYYLGRLILILI